MKKYLLIFPIFFTFLISQGQQLPVIGQYMFNKLFLNPAYAGTNEALNANFVVRSQWSNLSEGFLGAPKTMIFNMDAPIQNQKAGLGLTAIYDQIGVHNVGGLFISYSYRLQLSASTYLAMGLKGGASFINANYQSNKLNPQDPNDPYFSKNVSSAILPKVGAGLYLYNPKYYMGFSVPDLIIYDQNNIIKNSSGTRNIPKNYLLMAGTSLFLSDVVTFQPNLLVKYYQTSPIFADINLNFLIKEKVLAGASVRPFNSFVIQGQVATGNKIKLGFASEFRFPTKTLPFSYGTYELLVTYGIE